MDDDETYWRARWNLHSLNRDETLPVNVQERLLTASNQAAHDLAHNHHLARHVIKMLLAHPHLSLTEDVRGAMLANPSIPEDILSQETNGALRSVAAYQNPNLPLKLQMEVAHRKSPYMQETLAELPSLHQDVQVVLWKKTESSFRSLLQFNSNLHPEVLRQALKAIRGGNGILAQSLSLNPHLPLPILEEVALHAPEAVLANPQVPQAYIWDALEYNRGLCDLAKNPNLSPDIQRHLAQVNAPDVLHYLGLTTKDTSLQADLVHNEQCRMGLSLNSHLAPHLLQHLMATSSPGSSDARRIWRHQSYIRDLTAPAQVVIHADRNLLVETATRLGADVQAVEDLAPGWERSVQDLLDVVHLTQR